MSATKDARQGVITGVMARRRRVITAALLVALAWVGGCAPLWPGQPGERLSTVVPAGKPAGASAAVKPGLSGLPQLGGQGGLHASSATEVPITLPSGRQYVIHVPKVDDGRPRPLVIALHGMYLGWQNMAWSTGLSGYADAHDFLVAYGIGVHQAWNIGGGCCADAAKLHVDDVGYLVGIVKDIESRIAVDESRVYLMGFSTGDSMALFAQCSRPDIFAATAGSSGALLFPCHPRLQVRDLHLHGRLDRTVPYRGGFAEILNRHVTPAMEFGTRLEARDPGAIVTLRTMPCGHMWPRADNACGLDGTDVAWRWLSQFTR
jgi:polyhydroxybutyrate depolymerase